MLTDSRAIRTYFAKLGLESEIADIYMALYSNGPQNMSELSRSSGVERTRLYRLIDHLMESNLVEIETGSRRGVIKAAPIANIRILINQKEQELHALTEELELIEQVLARNSLSNAALHVHLHQGPDGIRQSLRKVVQASGSVLCALPRPLQEITGASFYEEWIASLQSKEASLQLLIPKEQVAEYNIDTYPQIQLLPTGNMPPVAFVVYDNIVAYYIWHDTEASALEISDQRIAITQQQFFALLWAQSAAN